LHRIRPERHFEAGGPGLGVGFGDIGDGLLDFDMIPLYFG
jgi:hypothetical protein